jgi:NAD(P)-dependent dehydrogenase (short-subunit alcohol dehydrogenase family)
MASEGARVIVNDLGVAVDGTMPDNTPAQEVVNEIKARGGDALANYSDVSDLDQAEDMVRTALNEWGQLDILVCVAGILRDRMVFNMTGEEWDSVVKVHMRGTFAPTKFAAIHWRTARQGGRLITFTSGSGLFGAPGQPNYAAAKMGIWGFTLSCARSLGRYGVTANSIGPGAATRMTATVPSERRRSGFPGDDDPERSPANIAPPLVYLASEEGGWVSGRCFGISGYRVTLYNNIGPEVVLQGDKRWTVDSLAEQFKPTFGAAIKPIDG